MLFLIGLVVVISCVLVPYYIHGGHLGVLWQPAEFVIIFGAAIGAFIIGSPMTVIKGVGAGLGVMLKGTPYSQKPAYLEVLGFFFELSKLMRSKGIKEVEQQIDHPHESALFQKYPIISKDHHVEQFICDNVRLIVMGSGAPHQLDELMDEELHQHHTERAAIYGAVSSMADGMPALGIVAAVLGVIHTMGSITEPPEVLGHLIGAALVGTFAGVLLSYGLVAPMAKNIEMAYAAEGAFYKCLKVAILNFARQISPQMIAEYTRKHMPNDVKPTFNEAEEYLNGIAK
ncbi:MAG: flagellar motor stator protein MotA [Alphaproteobacteria bacterium]